MLEVGLTRIRDVEESDLHKVLDLEYRCFPDPYPLSLLHRLYSMHKETFLVAECSASIVGYVIGAIRWLNTGNILAIGVDPAFRGRGVGSTLMREVMERFQRRGVKVVRLEVRKSNIQAQNFYRKLGFTVRFEVPFYYADGESAITMEKNLSPCAGT